MQPDTLAALVQNCRKLYVMIEKLQSFKVQNMGQIFCVKKVPLASPVTYSMYILVVHTFVTFRSY